MARKKRVPFKFTFLGKDWTAFLHTKNTFIRKFGNCAAITLIDVQEVHFRDDMMMLSLFLHEAFHLSVASTNIEHADLEAFQLEEVAAALFSEEGVNLLNLGIKIQTHFLTRE